MADEKCKECGCICAQCRGNVENHADMHLHVEIEHLRQRLLERDSHIVTMETQFLNEADRFPNGELASMREEMLTWQDKYARLYEAHKRVQKVNQNLEDKLLRIVDKCETEKSAFTKDIATLSHRLADANYTIHRLTQDNEKYRNDVNLAIQLLQCKPSNFVSQRYDSLPSEVQAKVRTYVSQKRVPNEAVAPPDVKSITVPISTFPPTAMVYNVTKTNNVEKDSDDESDDSKPPVDIVSAAIMAKVLEERERERVFAKHCDTCTCHRSILTNDVETQTLNIHRNESDNFTSQNFIPENMSHYNNGAELKGQNEISNQSEDSRSNLSVNNTAKRAALQLQYVNERGSLNHISMRKDAAQSVKSGDNGPQSKKKNEAQKDSGTKKIASQYSPMKRATFNQNPAERSSRQSANYRVSKKTESHGSYRLSSKSGSEWTKYEQLPNEIDLIDLKQNSLPQRQIDVINDRIWKNDGRLRSNGGLKSSSANSSVDAGPDPGRSEASDHTIDVINDRTWKSNVNGGARTDGGIAKPRMTLIEVKPLTMDSTSLHMQHHQQQTDTRLQQSEDTASPSFSSDSLVISSSDPPSTSSELGSNRIMLSKLSVNSMNNNNINNSNSLMSNWQDRTTGPRGCSMRITPGSKNILLDNAGHYQTILYTSGTNGGNGIGRPNTALVHSTAKSSRSGGSTSTSSDENSPVLPSDNSQLQRVAEWIKASGPIEREVGVKPVDSDRKSNDEMSVKTLNTALTKIKDGKSELMDIGSDNNTPNGTHRRFMDLGGKKTEAGDGQNCNASRGRTRDSHHSRSSHPHSLQIVKDGHADLISFESPTDDGDDYHQFSSSSECLAVGDGVAITSLPKPTDVKVTREMEETYLKLAASLDPTNLGLSDSQRADITIEKYRKEYKRTHGQKLPEKNSGSTS
ncbi:exonuclease 1 isoform X1 [Neodiprion lecontei]|uniref:Exonuclease 1 isoform X1 n=2 Tax=Neodiprion lecontei TaxID=441921 RepID=A0A6J0BBE1_NEOLC|nr:exonuclease 1 isoform X1 [Neodiprion lecontei]XP_046598356.1 exonuclease 1 isoform X1 [Neodiprion lecontei]